MTNEELIKQVETLYNNGEYNKVISLIESLPKEQQTYQILFMLASAYSDSIDENHEDNSYKAISVLKKIHSIGESDLNWLYLMGKTYFDSNKEEYAIEYFDRITKICKCDKELSLLINVQHFIDSCKQCLYGRALSVIFIALQKSAQNNNICNTGNNKAEIFFNDYGIRIVIEINNTRRSGATLLFQVMYKDNSIENYSIDGDANTYENGINDALNEFIQIFNSRCIKH